MEFLSIYDVMKELQVSGSPDYDVVMTEYVSGLQNLYVVIY